MVRSFAFFTATLLHLPSLALALPTGDRASALQLANGDWAELARTHAKDRDPGARLALAQALIKLGKPRAARRALRHLQDQLPHLSDIIHHLKGQAWLASRHPERAAHAFRRSIAATGSRWVDRSREGLVEALLASRHPSRAIRPLRLLLKSYPHHPRKAALELGLARALLAGKQPRPALALLEHLERDVPELTQTQSVLSRLRRRYRWLKYKALSIEERFARAKLLRRGGHYRRAIRELKRIIRSDRRSFDRAVLAMSYVQWKAGQPAAMLETLAPLLRSKTPSRRRSARTYAAAALGWLGRVDEGFELYRSDLPKPGKKKLTHLEQGALAGAARFLAEHGRNARALPLYKQLVLAMPWSRALRRRLSWVAYRAGDQKTAIEGFAKYFPREKSFAAYWQARSYEKQGQTSKSIRLYRQIVESDMRGYYGHLARSALVAAKQLQVAPQRCDQSKPHRPNFAKTISVVRAQGGPFFPQLDRIESLWHLGLRQEARRELRVLLIDYTWALYNNRKLAFRIRSAPLRIWNGAALGRRNWWGKRYRALRKRRAELSPLLGQLAMAAGVDYLGWRLSPPHANDVKRRLPQAYDYLVQKEARRHGIDPSLLWAIMYTESRYRPDVVSRVNAGGLMQLMPATARRLADELGISGFSEEDIFEPDSNLRLSAHYLDAVLDKFQGQIRLAAAAYNGGPHNVARWLTMRGTGMNTDEFVEEIPFDESRNYAKMVVRLISLYERAYCNRDDMLLSNTLKPQFLAKPDY